MCEGWKFCGDSDLAFQFWATVLLKVCMLDNLHAGTI